VQWGMTPLDAIRAATTSAARALGRESDVGAIAVGHYGDMVAVRGDPLRDVSVLEHPVAVVKGGVEVK
jgi:imidazolonepropionase-like amidohydrolase